MGSLLRACAATVTALAAFLATVLPAAADTDPPEATLLHQYFGADESGALVLMTEPPLVKEPGTWTQTGRFDPRQGVTIRFQVNNSDPRDTVVEDAGVQGWMSATFSFRTNSQTPPVFGAPSGKFAWTLVEGASSSTLALNCRNNDPYYCQQDKKAPHYEGSFPGHGADTRPHSHGNATHKSSDLSAGEFSWVLSYVVPPCSTSLCPLPTSSYQYTFTLRIDGTTYVEYLVHPAPPLAGDAPAAAPDTDEAADSDASGNATTANGTSAQGSGAAAGHGSALAADGYEFQPAKSPGLPTVGLVAALAAGLVLRRRLR